MSKAKRLREARAAKVAGPFKPVPRVQHRVRGEDREVRRYVSDKRTANVEGVCALCLTESTLELGHIWPNWAGQWAKGEGGVVHFRADVDGTTFGQDANKHYMLCTRCERFLGDGENRLRLLSAGTPHDLNRAQFELVRIEGASFEVGMSERRLISRALLGIGLKAHFAPSLSNKIKPESAIDQIRGRIQSGDWANINVFAAKWYSPDVELNPRSYAGFAAGRTSEGVPYLFVALAGIDWWVILGSPPEELSGSNWRIELSHVGMRAAWFDDWEERLDDVADKMPEAIIGTPCPCGSLRLFESCCQGTWYAGLGPSQDVSGEP